VFEHINNQAKQWAHAPDATPLTMLAKSNTAQDDGNMSFGKHFFPNLKHSSSYFGALNNMMVCAEANKNVSDPKHQEAVCAREFKALRLAAFDD
jgi:hypothetical protein